MDVGPAVPSADIYLPTGRLDRSVKLRAGMLEVKHRMEVSPEGLERWLPTARHEFPLDAAGVATLQAECDGAWREPPRSPLDVVAVVTACEAHGMGSCLTLLKRRRRLRLGECRGEHVRLVTPAGRFDSLAFEDERPDVVLAALRSCALDPAANTSYPALLAPWWHAAVPLPLSR
jgi:exopolyphosphatase/guanosine-5'-triphosphate,3'-diphosphate pyrophosphatase